MGKIIKWGILGPGRIANSFAKGLKSLPDASIVAVGSRSKERADTFAREYGIAKSYGSYQELANYPEVDIIYIATPHPNHKESALLCLKAGKAVICEKPFTVNAAESEELIKFAREQKLFLTEAMWTRYLPASIKVRELLSAGIIGDIKIVKADSGFICGWDTKSRLLNPELGGGALLDIGVYPISYASMIFNAAEPIKIVSIANIGVTGVDEDFSTIIGYEGESFQLCPGLSGQHYRMMLGFLGKRVESIYLISGMLNLLLYIWRILEKKFLNYLMNPPDIIMKQLMQCVV